MRSRSTRRRRLLRIAILLGAALFWMGPPRPPGVPGCRGPRPPRPPMPFHEAVDVQRPAHGAALDARAFDAD